jgi:PAS domain S-box-containing protein
VVQSARLGSGIALIDLSSAHRLLFEAAPHAYLALRAEPEFTILFANAKYLATTGEKSENIVGRPLFAVLRDLPYDPELVDADDLRASLHRAIRQGLPDDMGVCRYRRADGRGGFEVRTWKRVNTPILDESGKAILILSQVEDVPSAIAAAAARSSLNGSASDPSDAPERRRIVIAESDADTRLTLDRLLQNWGYDTIPVADAEAAMAACFSKSPTLLLSDITSPGIDGLALTRRLRADERTAALPIMILSQHSGEDARIKGYEAGVDEYMEKPFAARELIARIESLVALAGARADIAGRLRRVAVLARLASVVETAMDAVISIDTNQKITLFNAAAEKMFGCDAISALGRPLDDFIPHRFRAAHARHVDGFGKTGVSGRTMGRLGDLTALRANGVEFPIEASISRAQIDGEVLFTVILRDMSEREAAAETQRLLIGELDHRVKNTLAIVQAMANQTAKAYVDPKMFVESFNGRISAMASAHTLLTEAGWKGADLGSLLREQLTLGVDPRIVLAGPPVSLRPQFALHFGMVLYELGSNARKYGALSRDEGRLDLCWTVETIENAPYLAFDWIESGGPPTEKPRVRHFGTRLIETSLTHALQGKVELDFAPEGLCCRILLPLRPGIA